MTGINVVLTPINEFWDDEYVNMACTGPQDGEDCPHGTRQAVWALHDDEQAYEYLCRQCAEDMSERSHIYYKTPMPDLD